MKRESARSNAWLELAEVRGATEDEGAIRINRYFSEHPEMVLGTHALASGPYGEAYTCLPRVGTDLGEALAAAVLRLPECVYDGEPEAVGPGHADPAVDDRGDERGIWIREGSYSIGPNGALVQIVDGEAVTIKIRRGRSTDGIFEKHARIVRKLIPIRDAVREILKCQETDQSWKQPQVRLRIAWSSFVRDFGPINTTVVSSVEDEETGEVRETHRRPNLAPFADDPDCWLVASIEDYDLESNTAKPGPIFTERVIAPPPSPAITSAVDALAVVLNERGAVDPAHVAELLHGDVDAVIAELGDAIFRDPENGAWLTADAYLSGAVRSKLAAARAAAELDPAFARNVAALERVQPPDLRPSDITARLGAPWIPAADIIAFVKETMDADITIHHTAELACWTVNARQLSWTAAGTTEWGTHRRHAGELLSDALNSSIPQIFDTVKEGDSERRILNTVETEAAKEKLAKIKSRIPDLDLVRSGSHRPPGTALQRHLQQHRAPSLRRITSPAPGRLRRLFSLWAPEAGDLAHHLLRKHLRRARRRRRQDALDRGRDHGATSAWPDQQGHACRAGSLLGAGRARVPGAVSERPDPRRRRDEFREGEAPPLPVARRDRELGCDRHHAFRLQVHSGAVHLRTADAAGRT